MFKLKAVIWDHSFHNKSKSSLFLHAALEKHFKLDYFWDSSWKGERPPSIDQINQINPDLIIFYQSIPSLESIKKIKCKNKFWIPMLDDLSLKPPGIEMFYSLGQNIKIISFSETLTKKIKGEVYTFKYFPRPLKEFPKNRKSNNIFFWQRNSQIDLEVLKSLIGDAEINSITYKPDPDPGHAILPINSEDILKYKINILNPWLDKNDYFKYLDQCAIFLAPRYLEGIGISFLEAMSRGLCVISANYATANEYIINGETGFLFDPSNIKKIDFSNLNQICEKSYISIVNGYKSWQQSIPKLIDILSKPL